MPQRYVRRLERERDHLVEILHDLKDDMQHVPERWEAIKHLRGAIKDIVLAEYEISNYAKFHSFADVRAGDPAQPGDFDSRPQRESIDR